MSWFVCLVVFPGWCGYLHALELVPWWFVLGGGYLHTLELVPWWFVLGGWRLLVCLGACALVVRVLG